MSSLVIGEGPLTADALTVFSRSNATVSLSPAARQRVRAARTLVEAWVKEGRAVYGVTTGFGALCDVAIPREQTRASQENILMSHAAGVGSPLPREVVRAVVAVRLQDMSAGHAGIRLETLEALAALLNAGIIPVVPEKGSVGASGDLAPMAHLALVLIGKGEAFVGEKRMSGAQALAAAGLSPMALEAGEGLALINGTQVMAAITGIAVSDALRLARTADIACSISLEVLMGTNVDRSTSGSTACGLTRARLPLRRTCSASRRTAPSCPLTRTATGTGCLHPALLPPGARSQPRRD